MPYTPQNVSIFVAAFTGALAGMGVSNRVPSDAVSSDYAGLASVAGAYAQSFDTAWGATVPSSFDTAAVRDCSLDVWQDRAPQAVAPFLTPATYTAQCQALIAIIQAGETYLGANAISPSTPQLVFVYQPGGIAGKGIYTTWASLVAAVAAVNGVRTVLIDSSLGPVGALGLPTAFVPAGTWNFNPAGITGYVILATQKPDQNAPTVLQTVSGAAVQIQGVRQIDNLLLNNFSSLDLFPLASCPGNLLELTGICAVIQDVTAVGSVVLAAASVNNVFLKDSSSFSTFNAGTNSVKQTGGSIAIIIEDLSSVSTNQVNVSAGSTFVYCTGNQISTVIPWRTQASAAAVFPLGLVQRGSTAISVAGKTVAIPAQISAASTILLTPAILANDAATVKYAALSADWVNGSATAGSFKITACSAAGGGAANVADTSTILWEVRN